MTKYDLRQLIANNPRKELLNQLPSSFNFTYLDTPIELKGVIALSDYVSSQVEGWSKLGVFNDFFSLSKNYWANVNRSIDVFCNQIQDRVDDDKLIRIYWDKMLIHINNYPNYNPLLYHSPEVNFLIDLNVSHPNSFSAAYQFITKRSIDNIQFPDNLIGFQKAYAFKYSKDGRNPTKLNAHSISFNELQNQYNKFNANIESATVDTLKRLYDIENEQNNLANERQNNFDKLIANNNNKFITIEKETVDNFNALKKSYEELLSIKEPADYWQKRAVNLRKEGHVMMRWLIGIMALACVMLFSLLWISPETMLTSFYNGDKSAAVRWSIIFITLLSFFAIGIRALMKATFSALHLARDAEERVSLTYVYLAMSKDTSIKDADRLLVMQSLFSRADTGLLKEDSSPSMPGVGGIAEKIMR